MECVRDIIFSNLRMGDTFHSRSHSLKASVIVFAEAYGPGAAGRKAARDALRSPWYPNHSGSVLDAWGQKYPVEAGPLGYARGNFDEYRTKKTRIVRVQRWSGFDDPAIRELAGRTLERWARKGTRVRYDWRGAVTSIWLGRKLFPQWREQSNRWYCSEGAAGLHVVCGILGEVLPYNIDIPTLSAIMRSEKERLPRYPYPFAVMEWMASRSDFIDVEYEPR